MANFHHEKSEDSTVIKEFNTFITQYSKLGFLPEIEKKHHANLIQAVEKINEENLNISANPRLSTPWPNVWVSWNNSIRKNDNDEEAPQFETPKFR